MDDKILCRNYLILCLKISLVLFIDIRCHKSFGNRTWRGQTVFYADYILFSFVGGKYKPSRWLSEEVTAFKILQSCLFKRSLIETGEETKWCLWERSKIVVLYSNLIQTLHYYTERQYVKFGRTKDLNK